NAMLSRHPYSNLRTIIRPIILLFFAALLPAACDTVKDPIGSYPVGSVGDRIEVFEFGDFALYVPASVDLTKGLILALGGPDTRGFVTGKPMGAPNPSV